MSIEINVKCDGSGCCNDAEVDDIRESSLKRVGFTEFEGDHYCRHCWPKAKAELIADGRLEEDEE